MTSPAFRTIGCCVNRSPAADLVIDEAIRLRLHETADDVRLVNVIQEPRPLWAGPFTYREPMSVVRHEAQAWLDELVAAVTGSTGVLLEGHPADEVCGWAEREAIDLLVIAPHRGAFDRALHGEFAGEIIYRSPCPVLIVRPPRTG